MIMFPKIGLLSVTA